MSEFCDAKISDEKAKDKLVWQYIKANFEADYRTSFLTLLDYEPNDIKTKVRKKSRQIAECQKLANLQKILVKSRSVK